MPSLSRDAALASTHPTTSSAAGPSGPAVAGLVLLVLALAAALSVDVVRGGYRVKGDEATYVGMALSLAYDRDLSFEKRDLDRFWGLYEMGPEGIFLKRGKRISVGLTASPPFITFDNSQPDRRTDRLYFSKGMIYSVAAAPFVWLLGMNGFLVFHVLMLAVAVVCGYLFLTAQSRPAAAITFTLAFFGASAVPVYLVFLTPEIFNVVCVFVGYFFWAYKEVAKPRDPFMNGLGSDILAAVLLGIATYSKPLHTAPLVVPFVLLAWSRREWKRGFVMGATAVLACALLFAANAAVTGEFNYQGGDRRQFYGKFPFDAPDATWEARGQGVGTDDLGAQDSLKPREIVRMLGINIPYFLFGRHFGFVLYCFPGAVAIVAWLLSRYRADRWRQAAFVGIVLGTLVLLVIFPFTWSGDGGPPGNRYFMTIYPAIFFLMPPVASNLLPMLAWVGGALFTAKMLVNPFVSAKNTWEIADRGFARKFPVELTMANSLPVRLAQPLRGNITYSENPVIKLYFLDQHAWTPENEYGMWISGGGRADIIVRTVYEMERLRLTARSPINTVLTISAGAGEVKQQVVGGAPVTFVVPARGVRGFQSYACLLSVQSSEGFVPHLLDPASNDSRNLGAQIAFTVQFK